MPKHIGGFRKDRKTGIEKRFVAPGGSNFQTENAEINEESNSCPTLVFLR